MKTEVHIIQKDEAFHIIVRDHSRVMSSNEARTNMLPACYFLQEEDDLSQSPTFNLSTNGTAQGILHGHAYHYQHAYISAEGFAFTNFSYMGRGTLLHIKEDYRFSDTIFRSTRLLSKF
jgi:hypothetical protein